MPSSSRLYVKAIFFVNGTVRVEFKNSLAPGSPTHPASIDLIFDSPGLLTLALPEGWTPGSTGYIKVTFRDVDDVDSSVVNAACTLILIGTRA